MNSNKIYFYITKKLLYIVVVSLYEKILNTMEIV